MITNAGHRAFSKFGKGLHKALFLKSTSIFLACYYLVKTPDRKKNLSEQFLRTLFSGERVILIDSSF